MKTCALILIFLLSGRSFFYAEQSTAAMDKKIAALIGKMVNKATEQKAFADLESLGCPAVSSIIRQMDDRRKLPDPNIALRNKSPQAFEAKRFYGPKQVVDALAAILNQITGQDFGVIYNGATDTERTAAIHGWQEYLHNTLPAKLCQGG